MSKRITVLLLCLAFVLTLFAGCAPKSTTTAPIDATTKDSMEPTDKDFSGRLLDVLFMVGGQGEMANPILAKLESVYPGLDTNVIYDHNAGDILRTRVLAGTPPDIFDVNKGMYSYYDAIDEGVMMPFDFLYDEPCVDDPSKTIGDILNFPMMTYGYVDGHHYCISDSVYTSGLWYDANMFREKGYDVPETWDDFVALGDKAKADGKHLLCYSTKYGGEYFYIYFFNPLLCSIDVEAFGRLQKLEEGAFGDPAVVEALNRTQMLIDKGYTDTVSGTLEITETQIEFCNGNFLFYPCGSWLEAEMAGNWPDEFELKYVPFPTNKKDDPSYLFVNAVISSVSAKTENLDIVKEYYRYMLSDKETTEKVVQTTMNGMGINDFSVNYGHLLPESVASSWAAVDSGKVIGIWEMTRALYTGLADEITNSITALNAGDIDVNGFIDKMNEVYLDIRNDDSVKKRDYDMTALREAVDAFEKQ